jgi:hypothetical protein
LWQPGNYNTATIILNPDTVSWYTLTVDDTGICTSTVSVKVYPLSDSSVTLAQNKFIICPSDSAKICVIGSFNSYSWNINDTGQCITTSVAAAYLVTVTNALGCTIISDTAKLSVYPPAAVTVSVNGDTLISYNGVSYQWYLNNTALPGDTAASIVAQTPGSYTVGATDVNSCTSFSIATIVAGINQFPAGAAHIQVYPNPNLTGRMVYQNYLNDAKSTLSVKVLSGVYQMKISSAQGAYVVKLVEF